MRRRAAVGLVLAWFAADVEGAERRLIAAGFTRIGLHRVGIPGLELRVRPPAPGRVDAERLRLLAVDRPERQAAPKPASSGASMLPAAPGAATGRDLPAVAIATVDLERAVAAFGGGTAPPAEDPLLGARVAATATPGVLVAEPCTEGLLAATLARHGEGPAVVYVATAVPPTELRSRLLAAGATWRAGGGPFGPAVLATARARWGPHLVLVPAAADPTPSGASATIET